jgi:hypothetical protein
MNILLHSLSFAIKTGQMLLKITDRAALYMVKPSILGAMLFEVQG